MTRGVPEFYKNALKILDNEKIRCLRISDFNTPGLLGSNEKGQSPWSNLTQNSGVSDKPEGSGGSMGKGKFSSFVCSSFNTVFYSTIDVLENKASCGVARLSSYRLNDTDTILGEGYYGNDNGKIDECFNLDHNFNRSEPGTDIYILGFKNDYNDWKNQILGSILDNFFYSIVNGELEVKINNEILLSAENISDFINSAELSDYLGEETKIYYSILKAPEDQLIKENYSMFEENDLELTLKIDDVEPNGPNSIAIIRSTGMKIFDKIHLPKIGYYHGILNMNGTEVNDYFRKLENAQHNKWSEERASDKIEAKKRINELTKFIVDVIKQNLTNKLIDEMDVEGAGEFLPDEVQDDASNKNVEETIDETPIKKARIVEKQQKRKQEKSALDTNTDDEEGELVLDDNGNIVMPYIPRPNPIPPIPGPQPNPIPDEELKYSKLTSNIIPKKLRLIGKNKIILECPENEEKLKLEVKISGEDYLENINIKSANTKRKKSILYQNLHTTCKDNCIYIDGIKKDEEYEIYFDIDTDESWCLEVSAYGSNKK